MRACEPRRGGAGVRAGQYARFKQVKVSPGYESGVLITRTRGAARY
eukprot:SAG31_NODE_21887_length_538_cov_1.382688_2_plen_45_part_01